LSRKTGAKLNNQTMKVAAALALASSLGACATITRGTTTRFTVESSPPQAHVSTSSGFSCEATPCAFRMPRKDKFTVTVSKPGYRTATLQVDSKLASGGAAGFVGNALIGGVIGAAVDVTTGATNDLNPNPAHFVLEAEAPPAPPPAPMAAKVPDAAPQLAAAPPIASTPASASASKP
jgi:hypothetical protein